MYRSRMVTAAVAGLGAIALAVVSLPGAAQAAPTAGATPSCLTAGPPPGSSMPKPFLKLPFRAQDGAGSLYDSQAWFTSPDELDIDDETNGALHSANDLEFVNKPDYGYGLPILAAASGRAYFSYQYIAGTWVDPAGVQHQVGWGAGLFVEIRHAKDKPGDRGWVTQYIHLSQVAAGIPYLRPDPVDDPNDPTHPDWFPSGILQDDDTLWDFGVPVTQGQVIGYQGDTGIGLDWKDAFDPETGLVAPRDRTVLRPWDPPQLHFQLYKGRKNGVKQDITDPFGFYDQVCPGEWQASAPSVNPYTPTPGIVKVAGTSAFLTDKFGRPLYAG